MNDNTVEVSFRADLSDLESGAEDAVALLRNAGEEMAAAFVPKDGSRAGEAARRIAGEIARDDEQLAQKQIAAAEHANNFELAMGQESLEKWKQNAQEEADAKLNGELGYLDKKRVADEDNAAAFQKDLDEIRAAYQDHTNRLAQIDRQYAEKKRQQDQTDLQDYVRDQQQKLQTAIASLDSEVKAHQITAQQKHDLEAGYVAQYKALVDQAYQVALAGMDKESEAYKQLKRQEQQADQQFTRLAEQNSNQLFDEEAQKWTQLGNSIRSSFNGALDTMLFTTRGFTAGVIQLTEGIIKAFLSMGEKIAEDWIESQITAMFTTKSTQGATALGQVTDAAAVAGANTFAATSAIPIIGPELAPGAAAAAVSETMSFAGLIALATGAWDLRSDMVAQLHKGEMVVPENFASGLRGHGGGGFGAGDVNMHYAPTIHAREPATLSQMLTRESSEMLSWLNRQFRNGSIRV